MPQDKRRRFSVAFKLAAIARMEAADSASALARELAIKRMLLYGTL